MKLVVREYLSMLKETNELDALLGDLLLSMDIEPLTKAEKGVRQYGVDISALGIDPEDKVRKVFLLVVKQGNLSRDSWQGNPQAVQPSLEEIVDVYLNTMLEGEHKILPKKIIVCCNGDMSQAVQPNWAGYTQRKTIAGKIEFDFWGADRLAQLVEDYLLDEFLFPESMQKSMRKTLAFLDVPDYDLTHFYRLVEESLFSKPLITPKERLKTLRLLHLCLNVVFHYALEADNLKPAFVASERLTMRVWDWMRKNALFDNKDVVGEFVKLYISRKRIWDDYFLKIHPYCYLRDGLFGYGVEQIEYPLLVFEQIGIMGLIGFDQLNHYQLRREKASLRNLSFLANALVSLIQNNRASRNPSFDGHIIDICLGLFILKSTKRKKEAHEWIENIILSCGWGYRLRKRFPLLSDSYDELMDVEVGISETKLEASTLFPTLFEWCVVFGFSDLYALGVKTVQEAFPEVNMQVWYADDQLEDSLYEKNAMMGSGAMRHSIKFPESLEAYKEQILEELKNEEKPEKLTFIGSGFPLIGLIASRHYRTPMLPFYWRKEIEDANLPVSADIVST